MWWLRPFYAINTLSYDFCNRKRFSLHYIKYRCQQNWTKNWIENLLKWSYWKSKSLTIRCAIKSLLPILWNMVDTSSIPADLRWRAPWRCPRCRWWGRRCTSRRAPAAPSRSWTPTCCEVVTYSDRETETSLQLGVKVVRTSLLSQHSSYIRGKLHYSISRPNCLLVKAKDWKWDTETSYISGISTLWKHIV